MEFPLLVDHHRELLAPVEPFMASVRSGFNVVARLRPTASFSEEEIEAIGAGGAQIAITSTSTEVYVHGERRKLRTQALELSTQMTACHAVLNCDDETTVRVLGEHLFSKAMNHSWLKR